MANARAADRAAREVQEWAAAVESSVRLGLSKSAASELRRLESAADRVAKHSPFSSAAREAYRTFTDMRALVSAMPPRVKPSKRPFGAMGGGSGLLWLLPVVGLGAYLMMRKGGGSAPGAAPSAGGALHLTADQIAQAATARAADYADELNAAADYAELTSAQRWAMFLAQAGHESQGFARTEENLNYSADALASTFPTHFDGDEGTYARHPQAIANRVYADRLGNGPESSGDGWAYRGRGFIQLTGKDNYRAAGDALGVDFVSNPDAVASPEWAAKTAAWFWRENDINDASDAGDVAHATRIINGRAMLGLAERQALYDKALSALSGVGVG